MGIMFESSLLQALQSDSELTALLSTFEGAPSIFADAAPQTDALPYIVFTIRRSSSDSDPVQVFNVMIDIFGYGTSGAAARNASERVEYLLDRGILQHERYDCIRLFFQSGGLVEDYEDPRSIHENLLFIARAGRKKWSQNMTTLGY